ncbi:MAG: farnesyl-diphosphate synthase [Planctomycetota bacterium]|nr:MAG: farnesyl-diphosphate synthase [Planctomycetota bacterium]
MSAELQLGARLAELAAQTERQLERVLPPPEAEPRELSEAMRYAVLGGGKRVRPALALLFCEAVCGAAEPALPVAAALECVHVYSLVHDDLPAMDDDALRRGRPTCHKVYGEALAILCGDALLTLAFELLAAGIGEPARAVAVVRELAGAAGHAGMVGGQVLDLRGEGRTGIAPQRDEQALVAIHRRKTAALIRAACTCGALAGGAPAHWQAAAAGYGEAVGLLFQVTDDLLDVTASTAELGKTAGKDARAGKLTYPALLGLEGTRARAAALAARATEALAPLPASPAREQLAALAVWIRDRRR